LSLQLRQADQEKGCANNAKTENFDCFHVRCFNINTSGNYIQIQQNRRGIKKQGIINSKVSSETVFCQYKNV
jgi:hypothetical protein